ncbi:MAG: hypothetical protein NC833_00415 [Candidatus Omnitrophica bacterium]|nr:hypothetical protein [Candidatus Omnitrophota bacterium]
MFIIDKDFPGGNIIVDEIGEDFVKIRQDLSFTREWWFYWCFRIRNVRGKKIKFYFTDGNVFGSMGVCFSRNRKKWKWLGRENINKKENSFSYKFSDFINTAYFSFCIPYVEYDLKKFLKKFPKVERRILTISENRREVEHLILKSGKSKFKVLLTARHHACETMANFLLEGIINFWFDKNIDSKFLQKYIDFHIIPFIDKDGVEEGRQGKNSIPHDHNRDYTESPIYSSTRALIKEISKWNKKFILSIDFHCPYIDEEKIYIVEPPFKVKEVRIFSQILEETNKSKLKFSIKDNLPFGKGWNNKEEGEDKSCSYYIAKNFPTKFSCSIEFPYSKCGKEIINEKNSREFGYYIGKSISKYIQQI